MQTIHPQSCRIINKFEGIYAQRFANLCKQLSELTWNVTPNRGSIHTIINHEVDWISQQKGNELDSLRFKAFILLIKDLINVSWRVFYSSHGVELYAPPPIPKNGLSIEQQTKIKDGVREDLAYAREEQLYDPITQKFISQMEEPLKKNVKSVKLLLANGKLLAGKLKGIINLPPDAQVTALRSLIKPYLVLVDSNKCDSFTGIRYGDIWRYFRLLWAIPNTPSPGRKLFYLIRDAAQENHPIMAIAALSNAALQVRDRDDYIGWTTESILNRIRIFLKNESEEEIESIISLMEHHIEKGLSDIDTRGMIDLEDISKPTNITLQKLQSLAEGFSEQRHKQLQLDLGEYNSGESGIGKANEVSSENDRTDSRDDNQGNGLDYTLPILDDEVLILDKTAGRRNMEARRQMVFKKRSLSLYQLLYARRSFQQLRSSEKGLMEAVKNSISYSEFRSAITYAMFANKREQVGINMLEITTCGAVPPYNSLLGGKLMALMLLSPQVVCDYRTRYGNQPSLISSQVKGKVLVRPCNLVFLSTTSLYSVGSSQYNRLSLPPGTFHPQQPKIEYKKRPNSEDIKAGCIQREDKQNWQTSGYGTVHFSTETTEAIVSLGILESGYREVNSIFGEGPSPKLRKIRSGLIAVGLDPDIFLRHNQPRLLYCVDLSDKSRNFLIGEQVELPEYILHPENFPNASEQIAEFWRQRWLQKRISVPGILDGVSEFNPDLFTPKHSFRAQNTNESSSIEDLTKMATYEKSVSDKDENNTNKILDIKFVQLLYLKKRSYADFLDASALEVFHIPTLLDQYILDMVTQGYSVILTGNAGDGKTHLFKWLKNRLGNIILVEDASVLEPEEIINQWENAIQQSKPFCLAANEWPILELVDDYADRLPILNEIKRQLQLEVSLEYKDPFQNNTNDNEIHELETKLIVINLDMRNPLAPDFVDDVLKTILKPEIFASCISCPGRIGCDALRNRNMIMDHPRVREALKELINRLSIFTRHITVRELLGFVSYIVFGGRDCTTLIQEHGKNSGFYSELMFSPQAHGTLFDLLRKHLDPANISHPKWDTYLTFNGTNELDWENSESPLPPALTKDTHNFQYLKRRFYFEHISGQDVLKMLPDDERKFSELLRPDNQDLDIVRDDLVQSINAFFCHELKFIDENQINDLIVWSSHLFDERVPRSFTSWFSIDRKFIHLYLPQLSKKLSGAFSYSPNHLSLSVNYSSNPVNLVIDFDLYHTLMEVQRGLPTVMVDEGRSVRLYRFMSRLEASRPSSDSITRIKSYTVQGHDILTIEIDGQRKRIRMLN
jgi:hypothetical protein